MTPWGLNPPAYTNLIVTYVPLPSYTASHSELAELRSAFDKTESSYSWSNLGTSDYVDEPFNKISKISVEIF